MTQKVVDESKILSTKTDKRDDGAANKKSNSNKIWGEARKEFLPLSLGAIALVASSSVNQAVPRLMGVLMDPSKSTTSAADSSSNSTTERKFVIQILYLSIAGGTASFIRVSCVSCNHFSYFKQFFHSSYLIL